MHRQAVMELLTCPNPNPNHTPSDHLCVYFVESVFGDSQVTVRTSPKFSFLWDDSKEILIRR